MDIKAARSGAIPNDESWKVRIPIMGKTTQLTPSSPTPDFAITIAVRRGSLRI